MNLYYKPIIPSNIVIIVGIIMLIIVIINKKHMLNRILIIILMLIISQRPYLSPQEIVDEDTKDEEKESTETMTDIIFMIDNTVSMNANDSREKTRIKSVKEDIYYLVDNFPTSRYAIITFNNLAKVLYPFTEDGELIKDIVNRLHVTNPIYSTRTSIDLPADVIKKIINENNVKNKNSKIEHKYLLFFMSDGDAGKTSNIKYSGLSSLLSGGAVLGYGTTNGGKIDISEFAEITAVIDSSGFLIDSSTKKAAISKLDESNLKNIANNLKLDYYQMDDNYLTILDNIIQKTNNSDNRIEIELYYYFSAFLLIIYFIEYLYCRRSI